MALNNSEAFMFCLQCIGKTGEVVSVAGAKGVLQVKFRRISYRFNPHVLLKVSHVAGWFG